MKMTMAMVMLVMKTIKDFGTCEDGMATSMKMMTRTTIMMMMMLMMMLMMMMMMMMMMMIHMSG